MKKNKITFLILECIFLILTLFFAWKIFDRDVPEKRVAVILPESGDNRWNSLIKGGFRAGTPGKSTEGAGGSRFVSVRASGP